MKTSLSWAHNKPCPVCAKPSKLGNHLKCSLELERREKEKLVWTPSTKNAVSEAAYKKRARNGAKKNYKTKNTLDYFSKI